MGGGGGEGESDGGCDEGTLWAEKGGTRTRRAQNPKWRRIPIQADDLNEKVIVPYSLNSLDVSGKRKKSL